MKVDYVKRVPQTTSFGRLLVGAAFRLHDSENVLLKTRGDHRNCVNVSTGDTHWVAMVTPVVLLDAKVTAVDL